MGTAIWVNTGSGNGLVPDSNNTLLEPMLTNHQSGFLTFTWGQFNMKYTIHLSLIWVWEVPINIRAASPRGQSYTSLYTIVLEDITNLAAQSIIQILSTNAHSWPIRASYGVSSDLTHWALRYLNPLRDIEWNFKWIIFNLIIVITDNGISNEITVKSLI